MRLERIPVDGFIWGLEIFLDALRSFAVGAEVNWRCAPQRATITDEPCPNSPWLAVTPTVASVTWRPVA